jgi:release factor glutamine methyltransferase
MIIKTVLKQAIENLIPYSDSPQLDAELLLANALNKNRTHLHCFPEQIIQETECLQFEKLLQRRISSEPIAYILQQQSFWTLDLKVTKDVLIPRSETELLVEIVLEKFSADKKLQIADLGTGSGAIALAIASERPKWELIATDQSAQALTIAKQNAQQLNLSNVKFFQGDWCTALPKYRFDVIVSNPPYVAENDPHLSDSGLSFEPQDALISGQDGLKAIITIVQEAASFIVPGGALMLEHGYNQGASVRKLLQTAGYKEVQTYLDLSCLERVTIGICNFISRGGPEFTPAKAGVPTRFRATTQGRSYN